MSRTSQNLFIEKMQFLGDTSTHICYEAYRPHPVSDVEIKQILFADEFNTEDDKRISIPRLSYLCIANIANNYDGGPLIVDGLTPCGERQLGELIDLTIPLIKLVDLENETFWKRLVLAECKDKAIIYKMKNNINAKWKSLGIELRFVEIIETTEYESWYEGQMNELAQAVSPYVQKLKIRKLVSMKEHSIERNPDLISFVEHNVPMMECHYGNLDILENLKNLERIHLELQPQELNLDYHRRHFNWSYTDIENIARGFKNLQMNEIRITRSLLDGKKLHIIFDSIINMPLTILHLCYCQLNDDAGKEIAMLLQRVSSIRELNLEENNFTSEGLRPICDSINNFNGQLQFMGLARNIIGDDGVRVLADVLLDVQQVEHLDIRYINLSLKGLEEISKLIENHKCLKKIDLSGIDFGENDGEILINSLDKSSTVLEMDCRECGLAVDQMVKIKVILQRNNYYNDNPCFKMIVKTKEQEEVVNSWASRIKHPVLLKAMRRKEERLKRKTCLMKTTRSEALKKSELQDFIYDPNSFNENNIIEHIYLEKSRINQDRKFFNASFHYQAFQTRKNL